MTGFDAGSPDTSPRKGDARAPRGRGNIKVGQAHGGLAAARQEHVVLAHNMRESAESTLQSLQHGLEALGGFRPHSVAVGERATR